MPKKIGQLELYDVDELAKLLDIRARSIRAMLADGRLKGRKMARRWYVTDESLREYFREPEATAQQQEQQNGRR